MIIFIISLVFLDDDHHFQKPKNNKMTYFPIRIFIIIFSKLGLKSAGNRYCLIIYIITVNFIIKSLT